MPQDVFQAITDPTRRDIIEMLAGQWLSLNDVAERFEMSRPAVSRHIKILNECGLVVIRKEGRKRYCRANTHNLQDVIEWATRYRKFWNEKLDALEVALEKDDSQ